MWCCSSTQEQIFDEMVVPLVDSMLQGYNATLFAYGQTGSGKTHTMGSANLSNLLDAELGTHQARCHSCYPPCRAPQIPPTSGQCE